MNQLLDLLEAHESCCGGHRRYCRAGLRDAHDLLVDRIHEASDLLTERSVDELIIKSEIELNDLRRLEMPLIVAATSVVEGIALAIDGRKTEEIDRFIRRKMLALSMSPEPPAYVTDFARQLASVGKRAPILTIAFSGRRVEGRSKLAVAMTKYPRAKQRDIVELGAVPFLAGAESDPTWLLLGVATFDLARRATRACTPPRNAIGM